MSDISLNINNTELNNILELTNNLCDIKEEYEKTIEITENGIIEIIPDNDKVFSKVNIMTNIETPLTIMYSIIYGNITNINLSCNHVGAYAFAYCSTLTSIDLPMCSYVGYNAFDRCSSLTSVNLPMCSYIGSYAFYFCSSLESVNLPVCSYVGDYAFYHCRSLTTIDLPMCSYVGYHAFDRCSSLTSVNLPMCSYIGKYAFEYCSSLTSIDLPVCSCVGSYAFYSCSSLVSVNLPVCNIIYSWAFVNCRMLSSLTLGASSVVVLSNINAFVSTPMSVSTLTGTFGSIYVPASLVDAYKSATNWITYKDRITAIPVR